MGGPELGAAKGGRWEKKDGLATDSAIYYRDLMPKEFETRIKSLAFPDKSAEIARHGHSYLELADSLEKTAVELQNQAKRLAKCWTGKNAQDALNQLRKLYRTVTEMAYEAGTMGEALRWYGEDILPDFDPEKSELVKKALDPFPRGKPVVWLHKKCSCSIWRHSGNWWDRPIPDPAHVFNYKEGKTVDKHIGELEFIPEEELEGSGLGQYLNDDERYQFSGQNIDPETAFSRTLSRKVMDDLNKKMAEAHAYLPPEVKEDLPEGITPAVEELDPKKKVTGPGLERLGNGSGLSSAGAGAGDVKVGSNGLPTFPDPGGDNQPGQDGKTGSGDDAKPPKVDPPNPDEDWPPPDRRDPTPGPDNEDNVPVPDRPDPAKTPDGTDLASAGPSMTGIGAGGPDVGGPGPGIKGLGGGPGAGSAGPVGGSGGFAAPTSAGLAGGAAPAGPAAGVGAAKPPGPAGATPMPMMPMGGAGAGRGAGEDRTRNTWLHEDEDVWGEAESKAGPPLIE